MVVRRDREEWVKIKKDSPERNLERKRSLTEIRIFETVDSIGI